MARSRVRRVSVLTRERAAQVTMTITGDTALIAALDKLKAATVRKIVRPAVRTAISPINKAAKRKAPKRAPIEGYSGGQLRKSIGIKEKTYPNGVVWAAVGARKGFLLLVPRPGSKTHGIDQVMRIDPVKYQHLVEFGTRRSEARPFLRPAFDEHKGEAFNILRFRCWAGIADEARRAAKT